MPITYADLHIHSKYSRGTSKNLNITNLAIYGKIKGLNLMGTGDYFHPLWLKELKNKLYDTETGIYTYDKMNFLLSSEISLMYKQDGKGRRIHYLVLAPNFETAEQINSFLDTKGRRDYDGRPIFGFSSIELVENLIGISKNIEIIPSHIWTPFFGLMGSMSGFDSLRQCFHEKTKYIHSIESGLSSDPAMNWRISELDDFSILSFSDAHSYHPWRLGRECSVFDVKDVTYKNIINSIRQKGKNHLSTTIEFYPEEGKYHYDGHRNCGISFSPKETKKHNNICPKCKKPLTIGVLNRVEQLADRPDGYRPKNAVDFKRLLPLAELIAYSLGQGVATKKVLSVYNKLIEKFGNEFNVLLNAPRKDLEKTDRRLADIILSNREGKIRVRPGYDGVYGKIIS